MKKRGVSPTDFKESIYSNDDPPPPGRDICGRVILRREEDQAKFDLAMRNYRKRTGRNVHTNVWSFPDEDLVGDVRPTGRQRKEYTADEVQTQIARVHSSVSHNNVIFDAGGRRRQWPAGTQFDTECIRIPGKEPLSYEDWWKAMRQEKTR